MRHEYKTIDNLIETYILIRKTNSHIVEYLVYYELLLVRAALLSRYNKPSVHDLMIIREINKNLYHSSTLTHDLWKIVTKEILEYYRDRKVVQ